MSQATRAEAAWSRIEAWLTSNLPSALTNLRPPSTAEDLAQLEATLARSLPPALRAYLTLHDGEQDGWVSSALPDGHWLLPCAQLAELWQQQASLAEEEGGTEDAFDFWKAQVEDGIIFVQGPVKPKFGSRAWVPFSTMDGHVQRFVDLDPAPGGLEGQVIEVDLESCTYRVLSPSFADFLEVYATSLEQGDFSVGDDGLRSDESNLVSPTEWGVPAYLAAVSYETASPDASTPTLEEIASGQEVTFEGEMGVLMGGPETIFSLEAADGQEHTFLAQPGLTKGYSSIAVQQGARVRARRYTSDTRSFFVDQAGSELPDFVALEYTALR